MFIGTAHEVKDHVDDTKTTVVKSKIVPITPAEADKIISDWLDKLGF